MGDRLWRLECLFSVDLEEMSRFIADPVLGRKRFDFNKSGLPAAEVVRASITVVKEVGVRVGSRTGGRSEDGDTARCVAAIELRQHWGTVIESYRSYLKTRACQRALKTT